MDIEALCENSFSNFHAKGVDYLCLRRSVDLTLKFYFFDHATPAGSIVAPHNHLYNFKTRVLAGMVGDDTYSRVPTGMTDIKCSHYQRFEFSTPLRGGTGFLWEREELLRSCGSCYYVPGQEYSHNASDIHTLDVVLPGTVLMLWQGPTMGSPDVFTRTWVPGSDKEPPSLSGLYDKMTPDRARLRLRHLQQLL